MQTAEKLSKIVSNSDAWILSSAEFQELATELLKQGLVAHYPFNGNADDSSGNGLHGSVYGAILTKDRFGNPNSAYQFDGIDDYIEIPHNDLLNLTDNFTIALWINQPEDNSLKGYRLIDKTTAGVNDGYNFDTYDGSTGRRLRLTGGKQNVSAHTAYSLNEWHHVAVVFSKGVSTFYLDGNLDGSGQHLSETVSTNSLTLKIGAAHNSHTEFFKGMIDDVRIYNRALSEKDIQELYEFPTALRQCVLEFNGQNNYVSLPAANIDYSQGFSVEAWVRYNSFKYWSRIIDFGNGVNSNNMVFANPETTNQLAIDVKTSAGERRITSAAVLETGKWMHLAATIDQSGMAKLYKNGELIQSGQLQLPATINRTQNYIGRSNWPQDGYFDGQISEVRVWNITRSQAEIQQHLHSRLTGNEAGLVGYWQLNECSGTVVADKTSRANHGTVNGAIWQQQELLIKPAPAPNLESVKPVEPAVNLPDNSKIKLQSWKGDYLHRPDSQQGVTTWGTGIGNEWLVESVSDRIIRLKILER
ncbi:LamG domain-containing protein [Nostoc piscinale]|uniref:LamG domain-containing protein n=1 Tax=Nostoc piscinale TaxID=224012 RepID=UPI000785C765|nr:LamG domain-containing protein [Nostoc piscinale]